MDSRPNVVLALPPCMVCSDHAARWQAVARGLTALVCDDCLALTGGTSLAPLVDAGGQPPITADQARAYLAAQTWTYARTMPKWPHEYVLLRKSTDLWMHLGTVALIRAEGEKRRWRAGRIHSYWQPGDGTEVWTMRDFDTILNRRRLDQ